MNRLKNLIKRIYATPVQLTGQDYKSGQAFLILECIGGTSLIRLSQGAFIVGFATMIGMSPGLIGMLSAIPMLAHIFQIFGGIYFGNKTQYKLQTVGLSFIIRMLIGTIYFIPFFITKNIYQGMVLVVIYCIVSFGISFLNPPIISWIMDLSPESIRGQYFAKREMFTMIIVALSEAVLAKMLDAFKIQGAEALGFKIIGIIIMIWAMVSIYAFSAVKEPIRPEKKQKLEVKKDLKLLFKNKDFRKLGALYIIWNFSLNIGMLYIAIYIISSLKMSYLYAMIMSMLTLGFRVLSVRLWGRFVETHSWSRAIEIGAVLIGISTGLLFFANPLTALIILPISHILSGIAWGSIGITFFNLQVMFAPDESRTLYIGVLAALSGTAGFIATVGSGFFIDVFAGIHINFLNFSIGNMQIIFLISGILLALTGTYVKNVIAPMEQKKKN
ncbi:MAG TPA: MFS transporter [Epulopiscium sp.]|nr:MFS transporter [Candidatus Epulonipiscium sp.]